MYKKYLSVLLLVNGILLLAFINITGLKINHIMSTPAFKLDITNALKTEDVWSRDVKNSNISSDQRIIEINFIERSWKYDITTEEFEILLKLVEAEAGGEDMEGKMLVAGVVLNRVEHKSFPDTVKEVVFQNDNGTIQFSPVYSGKYDKVIVSEETIEAVERVLCGENITGGALYFAARKYADPTKMRWFDENLTYLFSHGGHEFFY